MHSQAELQAIIPELKRKLIHAACSLVPLLYYLYLSREQIVLGCGIISVIALAVELARIRSDAFRRWFNNIFGPLLKNGEHHNKLTGATHLFLSATVTFFIFSKKVAVPAVLILTLADSLAAISGKLSGKSKFLGKTAVGSMTFFTVTLLILIVYVDGPLWRSLVVAILLTVLEAVPLKISDNIWIAPLAAFMLTFVIL